MIFRVSKGGIKVSSHRWGSTIPMALISVTTNHGRLKNNLESVCKYQNSEAIYRELDSMIIYTMPRIGRSIGMPKRIETPYFWKKLICS